MKFLFVKNESYKNMFLSMVIFCLIFNSSCIHTSSHEIKTIESPKNAEFSIDSYGDIEVRSLIYSPPKLPLNDFFIRFRRGDFVEAFQKIDLNYKQSNINDKTLELIVEGGYIPAFVEIKNHSNKPISFDEKSFFIKNDKNKIEGFYSESLPKKFNKFNAGAFAANLVNTGVVIVGFVAVLSAMLIVSTASSGGSPTFPSFSNNEDFQVFNNINKTTEINYKSYLLTSTTLKPGESKSGMLFFFIGDSGEIYNFKKNVFFSWSFLGFRP